MSGKLKVLTPTKRAKPMNEGPTGSSPTSERMRLIGNEVWKLFSRGKLVRLEQLKPNPYTVRRTSDAEMVSLLRTIRRGAPTSLRKVYVVPAPIGDGTDTIVFGHGCVEACGRLGLEEIMVSEVFCDIDLQEAQDFENLMWADLDPYPLSYLIQSLDRGDRVPQGLTRANVDEVLGMRSPVNVKLGRA